MHTIPQKPEDLQPVKDVFGHADLRKMIQKARFLLELDRFMKTILPEAFTSHCQVMNLDEYTMVLGVTNAAIATRIQFQSSELLKSLRQDKRFERILNIRCRVTPAMVKWHH